MREGWKPYHWHSGKVRWASAQTSECWKAPCWMQNSVFPNVCVKELENCWTNVPFSRNIVAPFGLTIDQNQLCDGSGP
jgi:hypothetical protein